MARCFVCGKSEPVMKVVCSECAGKTAQDRTCPNCFYHGYDEREDVLFCKSSAGLGGELRATDYCSRFRPEGKI